MDFENLSLSLSHCALEEKTRYHIKKTFHHHIYNVLQRYYTPYIYNNAGEEEEEEKEEKS